MYPLRPGRLPQNSVQNIIFIVRPKLSLMDMVAQNVFKYVKLLTSLFIYELQLKFTCFRSIYCVLLF